MAMAVPDQAVRQQALNPEESFIVQAPAGSGKTELLIQRILVLLAQVNKPEEVVAITFTRKAAAEMRDRLLDSLRLAAEPAPKPSEYRYQTWQLAKKVLLRDAKLGWFLSDNPSRLQIMTIDALSGQLVARLSTTAFLGGGFQIVDDIDDLYRSAALELLLQPSKDDFLNKAVALFLSYRHNDYQDAADLLANMLHSRHVWLGFFATDNEAVLKAKLEKALNEVFSEDLACLQQMLFDVGILDASLLETLRTFSELTIDEVMKSHLNWQQLPMATLDDLEKWRCFCQLFLNQKGEIRKVFTTKQGLAAQAQSTAAEKKQFSDLKQRLKGVSQAISEADYDANGALIRLMQKVLLLPSHGYSEQEWSLLWAVAQLLKALIALLWQQFARTSRLDHVQVALSALDALSDQTGVTDLALSLDYQISHLLCDEFQDTSKMQLRLFELICAGWQKGDGRTLFFVGDPMQSIYRFRHAEVEIFLDVRDNGIADYHLIPLVLTTNFRSNANIVHWVNNACSGFFPEQDNVTNGQVCYKASDPFHKSLEQQNIQVKLCLSADEEVKAIVELIREKQKSQTKTAVLVRSRSHLRDLIAVLRTEKIAYQAIEIDALADRMVVTDLITLITVLTQPFHRLAWLAFLRAPWCGLLLKDIEKIANASSCIWTLLQNLETDLNLSQDAYKRLSRILPVLQEAFFQRDRLALRFWVQGVWEALGGSASLSSQGNLDDAMTVFAILEEESRQKEFNLSVFKQRLSRLKASTHDPKAYIQLMTIHKAKGLEFDCVILPRLHQGQGHAQQELLLYLLRGIEKAPILAPIPERKTNSLLYDYLRRLDMEKDGYERMRLFYVALTRAKSELHLFATVKLDSKDSSKIRTPLSHSFLRLLWPTMAQTLTKNALGQEHDVQPILQASTLKTSNYRLAADWQLCCEPLATLNLQYEHLEQNVEEAHGFDNTELDASHFYWHAAEQRAVGKVCHLLLQAIGQVGIENWPKQELSDEVLTNLLRPYGLIGEKKNTAVRFVCQMLQRVYQSPTANYLLSAQHKQAFSEYAILFDQQGRVSQNIVDRTFIDENNVRWIIDFKLPDKIYKSDMSQLIAFEKEIYQDQMRRYYFIFKKKESRKVRCALFFPMFDILSEYNF